MALPFEFVCPRCHGQLAEAGPNRLACQPDGLTFEHSAGIWHFLPPERAAYFERFTREYETIRKAEGRGTEAAIYYRSLPYRDLTGRMPADWRIRAASFDAFVRHVLTGMEAASDRPLTILDLGAGNGWLSNRLALRGHRVAAVDLTVNAFDGLGCHAFYESGFTPVQAEFDRLPFPDAVADLVIFNASLHYSIDYAGTLKEALRVLHARGKPVVIDSPVYKNPGSGARMVEEREAGFVMQYGFPSNSIPSQNYLTYSLLNELGQKFNLRWNYITPHYGLGWSLRPLRASLLGRREPAKFHVIIGSRPGT